ncbi:MAG: hypothetical protein CMJ18_01255 [Phycisphaeraceae bacterium]|nr:hypothetical protein [Phycisphaeraceae bacterium]
MLRLIVIRLIQMPCILAVIFLVTFALAWLLPGSPLDRPEGFRPSKQIQEAMQRQYNLDDPLAFARTYLLQAARLNFGPSLAYRDQTVNDILGDALPVSAMLGLAALAVALGLGVVAGTVGAIRPGSFVDLSSLLVALIGVSLPTFVTGMLLLVGFAGVLQWLPPGDWGGPQHVILPAVTLGVMPAAYIARLIRLGLADVAGSDYIRTARAKGLSPNRVLFKHALKVAFLPVLSFLGPAAAATMTGSFVVEKVFNVPGMGEYFVNAVLNKDQFLILGVVLIYSVILVAFNLIVDVAYAWVDPRIELE